VEARVGRRVDQMKAVLLMARTTYRWRTFKMAAYRAQVAGVSPSAAPKEVEMKATSHHIDVHVPALHHDSHGSSPAAPAPASANGHSSH
jgi:hypothetical protein